MGANIQRIAVTGAAGQIAYSLLFRLAAGELLGSDQPVALHLLEIPEAIRGLKGVVMELEDCAFPLLAEVVTGSDPYEVFKEVDYAFLVGAKPRGPGMERKDLLQENGVKFVDQGKALGISAKRDALILVVGNPCNSNCWIVMKEAPSLDPRRFFSMTRLDELRAKAFLARKAGVNIDDVSHMTIWGNHSSLQVPDFANALIKGKPAPQVINDEAWFEKEFFPGVQKRGAEVIAIRGKSSAASAANAALEAMRSLIVPTKGGDWFSMSLLSNGNPYGIESDLFFSFPCVCKKRGHIEIVPNISRTPFMKEKIALVQQELIEERAMIQHLVKA